MNDWMDKLESELGELAPRKNSRDLVAAALCAHRDSQVLTAKRLRRELTADELEAAFAVLDEKYPGVVADVGENASPVAMAFIQTPSELSTQVAIVEDVETRTSKGWLGKFAIAAALLICFAGGIAIGVRSGTMDSPQVAGGEELQLDTNDDKGSVEQALVQDDATPVEAMQVSTPASGKTRSVFYDGRQQSSLSAYSRAYHRKRLHASL